MCSDWPAIQCVVIGRIPQACDGNIMPLTIFVNTQRLHDMAAARIKVTASFFAYTFGLCYANLPIQCGAVFEWGILGRHGWVLTFRKNYHFGFESTLTFKIFYMHEQLVTLQRQRKTWNRIIWPLQYFNILTKRYRNYFKDLCVIGIWLFLKISRLDSFFDFKTRNSELNVNYFNILFQNI